jgi:hypothetical protein
MPSTTGQIGVISVTHAVEPRAVKGWVLFDIVWFHVGPTELFVNQTGERSHLERISQTQRSQRISCDSFCDDFHGLGNVQLSDTGLAPKVTNGVNHVRRCLLWGWLRRRSGPRPWAARNSCRSDRETASAAASTAVIIIIIIVIIIIIIIVIVVVVVVVVVVVIVIVIVIVIVVIVIIVIIVIIIVVVIIVIVVVIIIIVIVIVIVIVIIVVVVVIIIVIIILFLCDKSVFRSNVPSFIVRSKESILVSCKISNCGESRTIGISC